MTFRRVLTLLAACTVLTTPVAHAQGLHTQNPPQPQASAADPAAAATAYLLLDDGVHDEQCTGALVAPRWVLTAQHCYHRDTWAPGRSTVEVPTLGDRATFHPVDVIPSSTADLLLVQLDKPAAVAPLALNGANLFTGDSGTANLWNGTNLGASGPSDHALHTAPATVQRRVVIRDEGYRFPNSPLIKGLIQAGRIYPGDSGSPLIVDGKLAGILSTSDQQAPVGPGEHGLWVPVAEHLRWIAGTIGVEEPKQTGPVMPAQVDGGYEGTEGIPDTADEAPSTPATPTTKEPTPTTVTTTEPAPAPVTTTVTADPKTTTVTTTTTVKATETVTAEPSATTTTVRETTTKTAAPVTTTTTVVKEVPVTTTVRETKTKVVPTTKTAAPSTITETAAPTTTTVTVTEEVPTTTTVRETETKVVPTTKTAAPITTTTTVTKEIPVTTTVRETVTKAVPTTKTAAPVTTTVTTTKNIPVTTTVRETVTKVVPTTKTAAPVTTTVTEKAPAPSTTTVTVQRPVPTTVVKDRPVVTTVTATKTDTSTVTVAKDAEGSASGSSGYGWLLPVTIVLAALAWLKTLVDQGLFGWGVR